MKVFGSHVFSNSVSYATNDNSQVKLALASSRHGTRSGKASQDPSLPAAEIPDFRHLDFTFGPRNLGEPTPQSGSIVFLGPLRYKWSCNASVQDRVPKPNGLAMLVLDHHSSYNIIHLVGWWFSLEVSR